MEPNIYQENHHVHELYPGSLREKEGWGSMMETLSTDMTNLWERQSLLISTELSEKVSLMKAASGAMAAGGSMMFVGVFCLAATAILGLSTMMAAWIASAIVTVVLFAIGFVMLKGAQKKIAGRGLVPHHSIETLGQIKNTFQERIHEFKRQ